MKTETDIAPFDAVDYLDTPEMMAAYLTACMEDDTPGLFMKALSDVARAKGMSDVAKKSGLGRESLYKALSPGSHPRHETIRKIVAALGLKFSVTA